jgi:hypothetical protein
MNLPTLDHPLKLVSTGETVIVERKHSSVEEYAFTAYPSGSKTTDWTKEEAETKIKSLLSKGFEIAN